MGQSSNKIKICILLAQHIVIISIMSIMKFFSSFKREKIFVHNHKRFFLYM